MKTILLVALLGIAGWVQAAEQTISFSNQNLSFAPLRLVTFDASFGPTLAGQGVANQVEESYVARLFQVLPDGNERSIGAAANFRRRGLGSPGVWAGGSRIAVGVEQGAPMWLRVKVWDKSEESLESAIAAGKGAGESAVFFFQDPMSNPPAPSDNFMINFQGFAISKVPEPNVYFLATVGLAAVLCFARQPRR